MKNVIRDQIKTQATRQAIRCHGDNQAEVVQVYNKIEIQPF
jgi:hypothetical protein